MVGILSGIEYTTVGFSSVVKINWYGTQNSHVPASSVKEKLHYFGKIE